MDFHVQMSHRKHKIKAKFPMFECQLYDFVDHNFNIEVRSVKRQTFHILSSASPQP